MTAVRPCRKVSTTQLEFEFPIHAPEPPRPERDEPEVLDAHKERLRVVPGRGEGGS